MAESNQYWLELVFWNMTELKARGLYEEALLAAVTGPRINNHRAYKILPTLFSCADRWRLRAAGDSLPSPGPFTVYRGVAGRSRARRVRGYSWTFSLGLAAWFARRSALFGLLDPAVYRVIVREADVLVYAHEAGRNEQELLVLPDEIQPPQRCLGGAELVNLAEAHGAEMQREQDERMKRLQRNWKGGLEREELRRKWEDHMKRLGAKSA